MKKHELEKEVAELIRSQQQGMLSTYTNTGEDKAVGFPFGSMVRFITCEHKAYAGSPLMMLSRIAEHSKHLQHNNKVSLLISAAANEEIQQTPRLTLLGEMEKLHVDDADLQQNAEIYFQAFPESKEYFQLLDFDFYRLKVHKARYIGGFARAHWLKTEAPGKAAWLASHS
jgi:putative heme iron utilization protein